MKPLKIIGTFLLVLAMTLGTVACDGSARNPIGARAAGRTAG